MFSDVGELMKYAQECFDGMLQYMIGFCYTYLEMRGGLNQEEKDRY
jgi:hypothetical protein